MDPPTVVLIAVLVFAVASLYANLGLGGGLLYVPILLSTSVGTSDVAVPISLTLTIATAASSVINHYRHGLVDVRLGQTLVAGGLVGALIGTFVTLFVLDERSFKAFFTVVLLVFGAYMIRDWVHNQRSLDEDDDSKTTRARTLGVAVATTGSGFLSGSMGIGGGLLNVPLMVYGLGRKTRKAIGTSSLLIIPTATIGFAGYIASFAARPGGLAWPPEFLLIPLLVPIVAGGAYVGSRWGLRALRTRSVALMFILVLFVAAAKLVLDLIA